MPIKRYEILLPLKYNDGTFIEKIKFYETIKELLAVFPGITLRPEPMIGAWVHRGQTYVDTSILIQIEVEDTEENRDFFVKYKEILKERFDQIEIWITGHPIDII